MKLSAEFYQSKKVVSIARNLLGKYLFTNINCEISGGFIVETEAYNGITDKASHAFGNRKTNRTKTMYQAGGVAYVYLCYGIHEMLNVVTSAEGEPNAVLIRAINPTEGIGLMLERRKMISIKNNLTAGPGSVAKAFGVTRKMNGFDLGGDEIWIEDRGLTFLEEEIAVVPRVGVAYAEEDALLPYRFYVKKNLFVSKPNR